MDARRFDGKVALVTGGNSGIGLAVARGLVAEGARVVVVGRNAVTLGAAAASLGDAARGVVADASRLTILTASSRRRASSAAAGSTSSSPMPGRRLQPDRVDDRSAMGML